MTADYIAFHALERPDAVALINRGRAITYAEFDRDLRKLTVVAAELGVPRGGSVAIGADDLYTQWLLLLAFERLGIATISVNPVETSGAIQSLSDIDLMLAEPHFPRLETGRHHVIARAWLEQALAREGTSDHALPACSPEDPVRILRTSGTTGRPKRILHQRFLHDAWVTRWILMTGVSHRTGLLLTMSFSVNGMYACATACLRAGGTVVSALMPNPGDILETIAALGINRIVLVPFQIGPLLDATPERFAKPASLTICCFGAAIPNGLRQGALDRLATEVIDMYGSNEAGFIASRRSDRDDGISAIWPGVEVNIVDDDDRPLPREHAGRIRVKTPDMVQGYLGDAEATRGMFKDGWFYPGDIGILRRPRGLQILGRGDSLLNLGGQKLPPEVLEQVILKAIAVADVGVCSVPSARGIEEMLIALVDPQGDERRVLEDLTRALAPFPIGAFRAAKLPAIPRNANGKIQRDRLRSAIVETLRTARPVTL
jgi:acyl-coenzyme A synthetase/AMP-(fatty) acid ligase